MKNALAIIFLCLTGIIFYLLTLRGFIGNPLIDKALSGISKSPGPFESSHERAPFALLVSIAENNSVSLTKELADFASPDTVYTGNKFFIMFPPGVSILAVPFYLIGKQYHLSQLFSFGGMAIFSILNLLVIFMISKHVFKLPISLSILASLIFGFASSAFSYATSLYQHQPITFLILSAFYSAWKFKYGQRLKWMWAGWIWASLGLILWLDYPSVIFFIPIIFYLFLNSYQITSAKNDYNIKFSLVPILTAAIFILIVGLNAYYNVKNFGSWKMIAQLFPRYDTSKIQVVSESEKNKSISGVAEEDKIVRGLNTLTIAPDKGLFFFTPIFVLALLGILSIIKNSKAKILETSILTSIFLLNLFFYSSWGDPWGGWAFGPRYLVPSMAVLSIFVVLWVQNKKNQIIGKTIIFFLFAYSWAIALLGAITTTVTPPKVEADFLKLKYGFFLNLDFFNAGKSGSFIYNEFLSKYINLQQFFMIIYMSLVVLVFILLYIVPIFEKNHES